MAHSVLTEHLIDEPGQPTRDALEQVLDLFRTRLLHRRPEHSAGRVEGEADEARALRGGGAGRPGDAGGREPVGPHPQQRAPRARDRGGR